MAYGDGAADQALRTAWSDFCEQLKAAGDKVFKDANPAAPIMRADGYHFLTQNLGQAFDLALETKDPAYPQIHYFTHPTMKLGGDVSDFTYRQAWISGDHAYKITGRKGTARWFNLTVQGPKPDRMANGHPPLHEPFGDTPECNILGSQIVADADGNFELFIGGPKREQNWLPTTSGTRKLFIREAFDAWFEKPTRLTIERIGMDSPKPVATPERMVEAMAWAGDFLYGAMRDWPDHAWATSGGVVDPDQPNVFPADKAANTADDAKRGRMAANMIWRLENDEALIVEMDMHDGFWLFGMGCFFGQSMDYLYRQVSYSPARTKVDADNVVRFVISHDDAGVHNWLDTQGFPEGNLGYRNLMSQNPATFRTRLVKRAEVLAQLPAGTAMVTPAERVQQLQDRFHSIKLRFGI